MAEQTETCVHCGGRGWIPRRYDSAQSFDCMACEGTGRAPAPASTTPPEETEAERNRRFYETERANHGLTIDALTAAEARVSELEGALRDTEIELRQARGLKALLGNGMPPTGNPDFDEVLATHPIAAMIQRGWLGGVTGFEDLPMLEAAICRFYGVGTIAEAVNPQWPVSRPAQNGEDTQ